MAPPSLRHPLEKLLCEREIVHDAGSDIRINDDPAPPRYHVFFHFPPPSHRPLFYAELVRLRNVIAFRDGTEKARRSDLSRTNTEDKQMSKIFMKTTKEMTENLEKNPALDEFYNKETKVQLDTWPEPEKTRSDPCTGRCCSGEPPLDLDRVIYRCMGEARPNIWMLEAVHFELFMPDRLDLRYLQVQRKVVEKYGLKEGMLVWISSSSLTCVPIRSRYRYRDIADVIPYFVSWRVNDIIEIVCKYEETWTLPYHICATVCDSDTHKSQQSIYLAGVCSRFAYPVYGRASLLDESIKTNQVFSATITRREAAWVYSVEPVRNLALYQKCIDSVDSSNMQSGFRVDKFMTERDESDFYNEAHAKWFSGHRTESDAFIWMMERSLTIGTAMARADSRDKNVECFGEFHGFLVLKPSPRLAVYPSHENPPSRQRYAILSFPYNISSKLHVLSITHWQEESKYHIAFGRRSLALENLGKQCSLNESSDLPCAIRFADSPTNALDAFLRYDLDHACRVKVPAVLGDLYDVIMPPQQFKASTIPKRSRRIFASQLGKEVVKEKSVRFATAYPDTSFAVIGEERVGKTVVAAAIALATPRCYQKLVLSTTRKGSRSTFHWLLRLLYTDEEFKECSWNVDSSKIPKSKMPLKTKFEDSKIEEQEDHLKEFLTWPVGDVVLATVDSILQVIHHHPQDKEDPLLPFLRDVHTIIIDGAETVTEAYFYVLAKAFQPSRVIFIGNHEKAAEIAAERHFHKQPYKPILHGIASNIRDHSLAVLQIKRSPERERLRASFYVRAPIEPTLEQGLLKYSQYGEVEKMGAVLDFLRSCRVPLKKIVVLTMDAKHQESMKFVCADYDPELEIHQIDDFVGNVRPVIILLGGWYARRYWHDKTFLNLYTTLYLDMLIFIGFDNVFKMDGWCEQRARRCLVERNLCDFPKKKK